MISRWNLMSKREKGIIIFAIFFVVAILLFILIMTFSNKDDNILVEPTATPPIVESSNVVSAPPEETIVPQSNVVSLYKAKVKQIIDYSTTIEYVLGVGIDNSNEIHIVANSNTSFIDLKSKSIVTPKTVSEGSDIVVYVNGNVIANDLTAIAILIGDDTSYSYAKIVSIEDYNNEGYLWEIENTTDRLYVGKENCNVIDAYTGAEILNMGLVKENNKVLYISNPDFEISENGNIYYCNEVIVIKDE